MLFERQTAAGISFGESFLGKREKNGLNVQQKQQQ